jgi:hypothetical protein
MTAVRQIRRKQVMVAAVAVLALVGVRPTAAQTIDPWTETGFIAVSGGGQTDARSVRTSGATPIFGESATWDSTVGVGAAGLFDITGGYRVWNNVAVALGYSRYSDTTSTVVNASIPDPLIFDMPRPASTTVSGLAHAENALHLSAAYVMPLTDRLATTVMAGPTFFFVRKDIIGDITLAGEDLAGATTERLEETAVGGHITVDVRYRLLDDLGPIRHVGVGLFLRYSGASIDAPSVGGGGIDVGGFNYGAGVRIGF